MEVYYVSFRNTSLYKGCDLCKMGDANMRNVIALRIVLYCDRVPAADAPGCTAAEGLLYKPWSLVVPTCTAGGPY